MTSRRHRRVDAAPTSQSAETSAGSTVSSSMQSAQSSPTPDADWTAWFTKPQQDAPKASAVRGSRGHTPDAQDRWYLEQRPPHWE